MDGRRSEHKVVLPDEVWSETLIQATLEQTTASAVCEYVLRHYVDLAPGRAAYSDNRWFRQATIRLSGAADLD